VAPLFTSTIGATTILLNAVATAADLRVSTVAGPSSSVPGNSATVTYTVPDGSSTQEQIAAPWTKLLQLETPIAVKVDVRPDESQALGCTIAVNDESAGSSKQVAEALGKEGELTTCEADTTAIDEANAGN